MVLARVRSRRAPTKNNREHKAAKYEPASRSIGELWPNAIVAIRAPATPTMMSRRIPCVVSVLATRLASQPTAAPTKRGIKRLSTSGKTY